MYLLELQFSSDMCTGVGLLEQTVALFLLFKGASTLFSVVAAPAYVPAGTAGQGSLFSMPQVLQWLRPIAQGHP